MSLLTALLSALMFTLSVECQSSIQTQNPHSENMFNKDKIYFSDNRPNFDLQQSITELLNAKVTENGPNININNAHGLIHNRPSVNLEPPPNSGNNQHYYGSNSGIPNKFESRQRPYGQVPIRNVPEAQGNISSTITNFGVKLIKIMTQLQSGNVVISPYSVATLLSLMQQGAFGITLQQISEALNVTPENAAIAYGIINNDMQKRNSQSILKLANNVFVADAFNLNSNFKKLAVHNFASDITPISFARTANAAQTINNWVASKTHNKIRELIPPEALSENSQAILVNAVYFKGLWQMKFRPEATKSKEFKLTNGQSKPTLFMNTRKIFKAGYDPSTNAQVVILPFEQDQFSLVLILPSPQTNLGTTLAAMTGSQLAEYQNFIPKEIDLSIPKFTVRCDADLNPVLRSLGITSLFTTQSELSGIGTFRNYSPQVSAAIHSAMLSIDENGGSAAAATAFAVVALSNDDPSYVFTADRPFIAVLWDNELALPLFMAKVEDPTL